MKSVVFPPLCDSGSNPDCQKRVLDSLELDMQMAMTHHVNAGYQCPLPEQTVLLTAKPSNKYF